MSNAFIQWLYQSGMMPRESFARWRPEVLAGYLLSDAILALAFYLMSFVLGQIAYRRVYPRFQAIFILSSALMFALGSMHALCLHHVWAEGHLPLVFITVIASVLGFATSVLMWRRLVKATPLPDRAMMQQVISQLEHEIAERKTAEDALRESQSTLRELAAYQESIREDERKRIAREIHDELGQNLLALRLDVAALHERTGARHPLLRERTETALEYIDTTMKSIRTIMNNLRPSVLDLGLQAAIEWQVRQFERRNGVPCELLMHDDGRVVPDAQAIAVFRILQESLNNIGRHARATFVRIEVRIDDRQLSMAIKDNGVGMYPSDRRKLRRFGLVGIQERVTILGGELHIDSAPGRGTALRLSIPLAHSTAGAARTLGA